MNRELPKKLTETHSELSDYSLMTMWRGSVAHDMFVPSTDPNSIDDKDIMSVYIPPLENYFGLTELHHRGTMEIKEGEWDIVCYEFRKFVTLLKQGNPNVMSMLWLRGEDYIHLHPIGADLIAHRWAFKSKRIYHSFIGYAQGQLRKMTHLACQGYMGDKRKRLVEKYGYDTKNAAHLIRLLRMGIEFLDTEEFTVARPDRAELLDIKNGKWTLFEVQTESDRLFAEAKRKFLDCRLPSEADSRLIDTLLVGWFREFFGSSFP